VFLGDVTDVSFSKTLKILMQSKYYPSPDSIVAKYAALSKSFEKR